MKQYSGLKKQRALSSLSRLQKQLKSKSKTLKGTLDVKVPLCEKDRNRIEKSRSRKVTEERKGTNANERNGMT